MGMTVEKVLQTTEGVPPNRVVEYEKLTELLRSRRIRIENDNLYLEPREITLPALPPIDDSDPVGWKERYVVGRTIKADSSTSAGTAALGIIAIFLIGLGIVIVSDRIIKGSDDKHRQESGFGEHFMIAGATIAAGLYLVPAGIGIAAAIARERQRRTLDDLLSIPWDRRQILDAKFEAIIRRNWGLMPMAGIATGLAFWASTTPWIGLAAVELVYGGTWMVIGLGALLTVRCANAILAFRFVMPAIVIGFGAPLGLSNINEIMGERWMRDAVPGIAAALAATGTLCWRKACRDFDRLG